jgi:hypothetical protein
MSLNHKLKSMKVTDIKVDLTKNVRLAADFEVAGQKVDTYDLSSMIDQIVAKGGIMTPIVLNGNDQVLQGFRRTLAGQKILLDPEKYVSDPDMRADLIRSLHKVPVDVYPNLTDKEELDLINDHGDRKGIGRTELVRTVWNLSRAGWSEAEIANQLYHSLAE